MGTGRAPEQAWRQERVPGEAELTGQMWGKLGGGGEMQTGREEQRRWGVGSGAACCGVPAAKPALRFYPGLWSSFCRGGRYGPEKPGASCKVTQPRGRARMLTC